jgi:hypothetical protein
MAVSERDTRRRRKKYTVTTSMRRANSARGELRRKVSTDYARFVAAAEYPFAYEDLRPLSFNRGWTTGEELE